MGIAVKTDTGWQVLGVGESSGGGSGGAPGAAVIGNATGAVRTYSFTGDGTNGDDGQAYDVYEFSAAGTIVVSEEGFAELLLVGGGAAGCNGSSGSRHGGGAGGMLQTSMGFLPEGNNNVIVGIGGPERTTSQNEGQPGDDGQSSTLADYYAHGGGGGGAITYTNTSPIYSKQVFGRNGGSGGGHSGVGTPGQGHNGAVKGSNGSGGGGAGGPGVDTAGGAGAVSYITGEPITYATGGSATGPAGQQNTGDGGGSSNSMANGAKSKPGGSGVVIARVAVGAPSYGPKSRTENPRIAHAARIEEGVVRQVIVIPHLDDDDYKITEFCNSIGLPGTWVDTSYTGARRGKYAGVGDEFHHEARSGEGEFVSPITEEPAEPDDV